jgi:transposase
MSLTQGEAGMPRSYPPEFRRKVLDLLKAGRTAQVAADPQISDQTIYSWRAQELIDTRQRPGLSSSDQAELVAARRRIAELETRTGRDQVGNGAAEGGDAPSAVRGHRHDGR